jgi:APA family basic amino acid/polyamine antiporter
MVYYLHSLVTFTQNSEHHGKQIFSSWYLVSLLGFIAVSDLGHMVSIGTLLAFSSMWVLVCVKKKRDAPRSFKPLPFICSIQGILICLALMFVT